MSEQRRPAIKLEKTVTTSTVGAKYCLWFTWAPEGIDGPEGEIVDSDYRPLEINVEGIQKVKITAVPTDEWSHHPGNTSNAGGIDDVRGLENAAYRSAQYNSENIEPLIARLNLLVGLLGSETPPTSSVSQIEIGLEKVISIDNIADTRLFLGFHDGRQWSNNGGHVNVTIEIVEQRA